MNEFKDIWARERAYYEELKAEALKLNVEALNSIFDGVSKIRAASPDISLLGFQVLLLVALLPGIDRVEIAQRLAVTRSGVTKLIDQLSERGRQVGERLLPGLGLLTSSPDPRDRRRERIALSPKGKELIDQMLSGNLSLTPDLAQDPDAASR